MARISPLGIWLGARKGAFVFRTRDRKKWDAEGPFFGGQEVHHVAQDRRDPGRLFAAAGNAWFSCHLNAGTDGGTTIARIWHIVAGAPDEPGVVYLGADPGALFRSTDNGANREMVEGLTKHATA